MCLIPIDCIHFVYSLQAVEAGLGPMGGDKPKQEREKKPISQAVEPDTPDLTQLEPPPFVVGDVPAASTLEVLAASDHSAELASRH